MDNDKYIGRLLDGRYEILEVIGTGGMAVVYKARCHRLNRLVAVKILKDDYVQDEEFRRRFRAEGEAVGMLSHPNIVSVYDVSSADHAEFIVMELIDGITLKQYMEKRGYLNWKETLHFAMQIAKALEHAHSRGLVHRDIKPHNVMVLKNGSIKVADFGIARVMAKSNTLTKEALGSVHYISPEQAKGGRVDSRSDIYSLGVVMYEMIAGRVPYDGESPVGVAIQHINGGAVHPSKINPGTPEGLEKIIMKAMALDPEDRYPTATAMLYEMDEFRKNPEAVPVPVTTTDSHTQVIPVKQTLSATEPKPKTIAERTAVKKAPESERPAPKPPRPKQSTQSHPTNGNRTATIAIISCAGVALIGLIIFLVLLAQGGLFGKETTVTVPNLLGQYYETLQEYDGIEIKYQGSENSDLYVKGQIMYQYPAAGDEVVEGTKVFIKVSLGRDSTTKTMQNLIGYEAGKAEGFLNGLGITDVITHEEHNETVPAGKVIKTEPAAGEELKEAQTVQIWISLGPEKSAEDEKVQVPDVIGKTYDQAVTVLNSNGFYNITKNPVDSDEEKDTVVDQSVFDQKVSVTTPIVLDVSTGISELPTEPDVTEPTEPDVTEPTEPDVTEPTEPDVTEPTEPPEEPQQKEVYFDIPASSESYQLTIKVGDEIVLDNMTITPGAAGVTVPVEGSGIVVYDFYYNGVYIKSETVDFDPDE